MSEETIMAGGTEDFAKMLEESFKTLNTGDKVTGIVTAITPTEVQVDLGTKQAGYIPVSELSDDSSVKPEDIVKVGDEIETYVVRVNDVEGYATLSKKRLDTVKMWETIETAKEEKTTLEGIVTKEFKLAFVCPCFPERPAQKCGDERVAQAKSAAAYHRSEPCPPPCGRFHPRCPV